jgi:hypothetical protein
MQPWHYDMIMPLSFAHAPRYGEKPDIHVYNKSQDDIL